ncbi:hypothetical protein GQ457_05G035090 [Hibiscus cannabinus]
MLHLFELRKQISCSLNLSNKTDNYVAFKVKTTNPKKYCVRSNTGVVFPRSTCNVIGLSPCSSLAQNFVLIIPGATPNDLTPEMNQEQAMEDRNLERENNAMFFRTKEWVMTMEDRERKEEEKDKK